MKKQLFCYSLLCTLFTAPSAALAQKSYALGIGGGAAVPVGKLGDTQKTGYNAMAVLAIGVSDLPLGVRFDGIYNHLAHNSTISQSGAASVDLRIAAALGNLVFTFPGTTAKAYVVGGGGVYNTKADIAGAKSENSFGVNGGLGATFGFGPFATFLEVRYHSISRSAAKGGVYQFVPVTLGVLF